MCMCVSGCVCEGVRVAVCVNVSVLSVSIGVFQCVSQCVCM